MANLDGSEVRPEDIDEGLREMRRDITKEDCTHFITATIACIASSALTLSICAFLLPAFEEEVFPPPAPTATLGNSEVVSPFPPDFFAKPACWVHANCITLVLMTAPASKKAADLNGEETARMRARPTARTAQVIAGRMHCILANNAQTKKAQTFLLESSCFAIIFAPPCNRASSGGHADHSLRVCGPPLTFGGLGEIFL